MLEPLRSPKAICQKYNKDIYKNCCLENPGNRIVFLFKYYMWSRCSRRQPLFLPLTQTSRLFSALFADFSAKLNSTHTTLIYTFRSGNISESNQHIKVISVHCTVTNKMKNPRTISAYDTKQPDNSVSSNIPCLSLSFLISTNLAATPHLGQTLLKSLQP